MIPFRALALIATLSLTAQTFRTEVKLVRVVATVRDQAGDLVGSLTEDRFRIWDSGVPQEIAVFERSTAQPLSVAVLIDASGSTAKDLAIEKASLRTFFHTLLREGNPKDSCALYSFNWEIRQLAGFTRRESRLTDAMERLRGEAGTSLYDAIYLAASDLESREGRKVMVIVTDGGDTTSTTTFREALRSAHRSDAVIYPILIQPVKNDPGRNVGGENALTSLSFGTGGNVLPATVGPNLDAAFRQILNDLRTQYLLGYYPRQLPPVSGSFRELRVQILEHGEPSPRLRVSARSGYYEEASAVRPR
jgi:Ca-activated chloride channel family protein